MGNALDDRLTRLTKSECLGERVRFAVVFYVFLGDADREAACFKSCYKEERGIIAIINEEIRFI